MKLLFRRDQRPAKFGGKPTFCLQVRGQFSDEERAAVAKYKLGGIALFDKSELKPGFVMRTEVVHVNVDGLAGGRVIETTSIVEMLEVEAEITRATKGFMRILNAALTFGGEEVVEIA